MLQGLQRVICYLNDILVCGSTEEHQRNLEAVLQRLQDYNIQARQVGQGQSCSGSTAPKEPAGAEILPRPTALLWKVYS